MLFSIGETFSTLFYVASLLDCTLLANVPKITDTAYGAQIREKRQHVQDNIDTSFCTKEAEQEKYYCGTPAATPNLNSPRVVNGVEVNPFSFPYVVQLNISHFDRSGSSYNSLCGGTIITNKVVLTAAHCVNGRNITVRIWTGRHYYINAFNGHDLQYEVYRIIIHPGYNSARTINDIALLETRNNITFSCYSRRACYRNYFEDNRLNGDICIAVGWGVTGANENISPVLLQFILPIISQEKCKRIVKTSTIYPGMMCAGYESGGYDTCGGDSGGPILCRSEINSRFYVRGITSFGEYKYCGLPGIVGIYTNVSFYQSWIDYEIAKLEP